MRLPKLLIGSFLLIGIFCVPAVSQDQSEEKKGTTSRRLQDSPPSKGANQEAKKKAKSAQEKSTRQQSDQDRSSPITAGQRQAAASAALAAYLSSPRRRRLGRIPRMFGDWFGPGIRLNSVSETTLTNGIFTSVDVPQIARVGKIAENNSALPFDRVFLNFNYFNNVGSSAASGPVGQTIGSSSVARYTLGLERTFLDGLASLETRFVFGDVNDFGHNPVGPGPLGYQTFTPTMGNLAFVGKFLLYEDESTALAAGLGLELPTGGDTLIQSGSSLLDIRNNAPFISPYIGLLKNPVDSPWFANAFVQLETPIWGDRVFATETATGGTTSLGKYTPQTSLFVDVGVGRWLAQNPGGLISGIAGFLEMHYNASLNDADVLTETVNAGPLSSTYTLNPGSGRFDVLDVTAGLHFEIADRTKLRIAGVIPVGDDRPFDSEFGIQLTRSR